MPIIRHVCRKIGKTAEMCRPIGLQSRGSYRRSAALGLGASFNRSTDAAFVMAVMFWQLLTYTESGIIQIAHADNVCDI